MKSIRIDNRFWIVIVTVIVLMSAIAYYFLVIVKGKEADFVANKFRVLSQIGKNITGKYDNLDKIAKNNAMLIKAVIKTKEAASKALKKDIAVKNAVAEKKSTVFKNKPVVKNETKVNKGANIDKNKWSKIIASHNAFKSFISSIKESSKKAVKDTTDASKDSLVWYEEIRINGKPQCLAQSMSVNDFFSSLRRPDDFDDFIVIEKKSPTNFSLVYRSFNSYVQIVKMDSLLKTQSGLWMSRDQVLEINGISCKAFSESIRIQDKLWIITGLVPVSKFHAQTRSIDVWSLLNLSLLALFLLLGMPLIKLWVMNASERLPISTVWFTGMSIVVGTSVLTLMILSIFDFKHDQHGQVKKLQNLADTISYHFKTELNQIHEQLRGGQYLFDGTKLQPVDMGAAPSRPKFKSEILKSVDEDHLKQFFSVYPFFNEMTWIDTRGDLRNVLFTYHVDQDFSFPNLLARDYVSNVINGNLMKLSNKDQSFSLQSISSLIDNRSEVGIGIPFSDDTVKVQAMATRLRSLMDVLLPEGFEFCVTDINGLVQFHSKSIYNLKENLNEEINDAKLKFAVRSRIEFQSDVRYHNSWRNAYGIPIDTLPFYLIVFSDKGESAAPLTLTITFAALFMLGLFAVVGLQLLLLYAITRRYTRLQLGRFFLHWMRPRQNDEYHLVFHQLCASFIIIIAMEVIGVVWYYRDPQMLFSFLISPLVVGAWVYIQIKLIKLQSNYSVVIKFVSLSFGCLVLLNALCWSSFQLGPKSIVFQIGLVIILLSSKLIQSIVLKTSSYQLMLFLWLVAGSVMPVYFFFKAGHYHQSILWSRYQLQQTARQYVQHEQKERKLVDDIIPSSQKGFFESRLKKSLNASNYVKATGDFKIFTTSCDPTPYVENAFDNLTRAIYAPYDSLFVKGLSGTHAQAKDLSWTTILAKEEDSVYVKNTLREEPLYFGTAIPPLHYILGDVQDRLFFILVVIVGLSLIYRVLGFSIRRIYGIDWYKNDISIIQPAQVVKEVEANRKVILVSLPGADTDQHLTFVTNALQLKPKVVDFTTEKILPDTSQNNAVYLMHFDFGLGDMKLLDQKLSAFRTLESTNKIVIVHTGIHPSFIYELYEERISELTSKKLDTLRDEYLKTKVSLREWKALLASYTVIYLPLEFKYQGNVATLSDWFSAEMNIGNFMPRLMPALRQQVINLEDIEDRTLLVEARCRAYYEGIWSRLSRNERFLLYDLARDRYMNYKNKKFIHHLISLGVIRREDTLRTMNDSFGQFVLTAMKEDEEVAMDIESRKKGVWSTVQIVLLIVVIGVASFLALTQQEVFHRLNTIITAVAALVAVLLRFGGVFGSTDKAKE